MILVVFRSRFSKQVDDAYGTTEEHLAKKVREMAGDDLVHLKNYVAEDGERLALVWWRNPETLEKWRNDPEHQDAQRLGRDKWYEFFELSVAEVVRTSSSVGPEAYPAP
ncbi:antibiotic biosynthesis monooxygenase family protein [Streptantibioticus ferralitis]|uniref:Antibiotic biosynthesis monooxygenase n=1 Tax=Streptantibioticus ferralitis TaxID=236510 RepID=A0ABT5ZBG7_9ACTN|nr:antibiotic biosynthesis monooxygenase [Streptantibioticus ferralitis]MDF2261185.1 antibiotic biosynthesis monooxygenase [Streptantibioticus ferralitis]